ncbi:hypothetical protein V5O48_011511 [Marasmius crinis-equi]|uniref:Uncharacterized protein n=1 Tax=Marasmius crinis-equi TaxID=585013 RepID=A0ABR3F5F3_9AGAR
MCHHLGLPVALKLEFGIPDAFSWSNDAYRAVHAYQLARGFDPTTTDFARSLRYPTYKPIQNDSDKFEELEGVVLFANSNTSIDIEPTTGRNSDYLRSSSPSVPYRSQMLDESDVETNCGYSDTDSDSDTSLISIPNDEGYIDTYDDYSDDGSDLSNASSSWLARSISESEVDGPSAISIPNIRLHNAYDGWGDTDSNFLDFHASRVAVYATSDSESEVDDLCIRFGDLALD